MSPDEPLRALLALSHELGEEGRGLAILGEGNTSARVDAETFLVKASGSSLGALGASDVVRCRFAPLLSLLDREDAPGEQEIEDTLLASRVDPASRKPSVEALFHAYLLTVENIRFVGHTHPINVNAILCAADPAFPRAFALERRFPDEVVCCDPASLLVPYVDPGLALARVIRDAVRAFPGNRPPRVILLENHGVITLGPSRRGAGRHAHDRKRRRHLPGRRRVEPRPAVPRAARGRGRPPGRAAGRGGQPSRAQPVTLSFNPPTSRNTPPANV